MTPLGWAIIGFTVAAGLFTWWIVSQDEEDDKK